MAPSEDGQVALLRTWLLSKTTKQRKVAIGWLERQASTTALRMAGIKDSQAPLHRTRLPPPRTTK
jgi:hypothetical protein